MTDEIKLEDWAKVAAYRRVYPDEGFTDELIIHSWPHMWHAVQALAAMIQKHEKPPVSRELKCAREALGLFYDGQKSPNNAKNARDGYLDSGTEISLAAIELYKSGFGE